MGEGDAGTAAVEVNDTSASAAREDDAPVESVAALWVEQAETLQEIARITLSGEMPAQAPTRGITDAQFFDQGKIVQSSLLMRLLAAASVTDDRIVLTNRASPQDD